MLLLRGVTKVFNRGSVNEKTALDGVDLHVARGDFVTIIGSNGAGKSTLLNAIAGMWPVDQGQIILGGEDITGTPDYRRAGLIGRVFQDPMVGTAASMTIEENMALAAKRGQRRGLKIGLQKSLRSRIREELARLDLGLENRLTTPVGLLSGGQRQALTLLMATLQQPKLLLLDEHTAALDPKTGEKVLALTQELVRELGLTTLMVTHNIVDSLRVGNRTIMMHEGKIVLDIQGEERQKLTPQDVLRLFERNSGKQLANDRMLLVKAKQSNGA
ncbi:MAG TPA: ABC transporter ATP-binding protein [Clostridia bacterium]|nr:ABC transporter ATP-binding protein [Clostridia bacterium]